MTGLRDVTVRQAVQAGYKASSRKRFAKLGDHIAMSGNGQLIVASILSTEDMDLLGLRFPHERHGQWDIPECYQHMSKPYMERLNAAGPREVI